MEIKMAKVFYTTVDRYVGEEYVRGRPDAPAKVVFPPGFDPLGRKVKGKGIVTHMEVVEREIEVVSPKGEKFKTKVKIDVPVQTESEYEKYVPFTEAELAAGGLLVRDEKDPVPEGTSPKPHFAGSGTGAAPPSSEMDRPQGRAADREPK